MAQDEYYYEIQLTNKQLVFYFMAGASGLVLSFLAGIMVGRGVDASPEVQAASPRPAIEDKIVHEEPPKASPAPDLNYSRSLESDRPDDTTLDKNARPTAAPVRVAAAETRPVVTAPTMPPTTTRRGPEASSAPIVAAPAPPPVAAPVRVAAEPADAAGAFTIQVGAFKDRGTAEANAGKLKKKGFSAYVVTPKGADGLFNVRVGSFTARPEAEKIQERLRVEEKYLPFIVKQ